jgi:uncharacterized Zn finger protein
MPNSKFFCPSCDEDGPHKILQMQDGIVIVCHKCGNERKLHKNDEESLLRRRNQELTRQQAELS